MSCLLGIDLGTSSVKVVVLALDGTVKGVASAEYPVDIPRPGYAEQDPERWWQASASAGREALAKASHPEILGIGYSGQMHGTVFLDGRGKPLRPAIIWPDQRSSELLAEIESIVGRKLLAETCGTAPASGFQISTLFWFKRFEPELLDQVAAVLLPKDFVRFRMTGEIGTDHSDAAGTGLFDVGTRQWASEAIRRLGLPERIFPTAHASAHVVGYLSKEAADALGLPIGIPVTAGCADQPAQAVANGLIEPPIGSMTIGTGGQVFLPLKNPIFDPGLRLCTFCHAPESRWYLMGAMLSAGMSLRWLRGVLNGISFAEMDKLATSVPSGSEGLFFLPYLVGERSPLMDPKAKGGFIGLTLGHGTGHLVRAVLEGVAFALRQIIEVIEQCGAEGTQFVASGAGLASPLWRQIMADVLARPLAQGVDAQVGERAGMGAAMVAGIGTGHYSSYSEVAALAPKFSLITEPNPKVTGLYDQAYAEFVSLYPRLRRSANFEVRTSN
jgi:xylulokinase